MEEQVRAGALDEFQDFLWRAPALAPRAEDTVGTARVFLRAARDLPPEVRADFAEWSVEFGKENFAAARLKFELGRRLALRRSEYPGRITPRIQAQTAGRRPASRARQYEL